MIDRLPRFAHRGGKRVLFLIEDFPLAAVVKLDQMTERTARGEELPFHILALGFRRQGLRHELLLREAAMCQCRQKS